MTVCFNRALWRSAMLAGTALLLGSVSVEAAVNRETTPASATAASLTARDAWIREVPPQSPVAAVFVELGNAGPRVERIVAMSSPLAARVEWHDMRHENGRMMMAQRLTPELPAGSRTRLAPMGSHLMLLELTQPLRVGMTVPVTLRFASGRTLSLQAEVRSGL